MKYSEKIQNYFNEGKDVVLPPGLSKLLFSRVAVGCVILGVCIITSIITKSAGFMAGALIAVYMASIGFKLKYDYGNGLIEELTLTCISAVPARNGTDVVFMADDDSTVQLSFPSKNKVFYENIKYKIYVHKSNSKMILTYEQI
ncbi:MAG: hypothetical protein Q4G33_13200 [bacterium]|nr:hypothetical protein [bacterium]